jgi:hypothetical protein
VLLELIMRLRPLQIVKAGAMALLKRREQDIVPADCGRPEDEEISQKLTYRAHSQEYVSLISD